MRYDDRWRLVMVLRGHRMTRSDCWLWVLLLVPACTGGDFQCDSGNPARPFRVSQQQLESAAYDRFFEFVATEDAVNRYGDTVVRRPATMLLVQDEPDDFPFKGAAGGYKEIIGASEMCLLICYNADPQTDPPPMQLQLLARRDLHAEPNDFRGEYGDPVVLCDLTTAQCEYVLDNGIPRALIDGMVQTARDADWEPRTPVAGGFGRVVRVMPDQFFKLNDVPVVCVVRVAAPLVRSSEKDERDRLQAAKENRLDDKWSMLVLWADGMLAARETLGVGRREWRYAQREALIAGDTLACIERSGFFGIAEASFVVPDGLRVEIYAWRKGELHKHSWNEREQGMYIDDDADKVFIAMWNETKRCMTDALPPADDLADASSNDAVMNRIERAVRMLWEANAARE